MNRILTTLCVVGAFASPALAFTGQDFEPSAKVKIPAARSVALKAHPGSIAAEELEREKGGSGLRYSFDIKTAAGTQEVGVDAMSGQVLEDAPEGADPDYGGPVACRPAPANASSPSPGAGLNCWCS